MAVYGFIPCAGFALQVLQGWNSALSEALAAEQADFDLGLVQPAAVLRSVMRCEPVPDPTADLLSEGIRERLAGVRTQVIHDQMDGLRFGILGGDLHQEVGELR